MTATASLIGRGFRSLLLVLFVLAGIVFVFAIIGGGLERFSRSGWTLGDVGLVILGLLFALLEWVASWPSYVWLLLIAAVIALRITSQLDYLASRIRRLERRVVALTKAIKKEADDDDFDDEGEW